MIRNICNFISSSGSEGVQLFPSLVFLQILVVQKKSLFQLANWKA